VTLLTELVFSQRGAKMQKFLSAQQFGQRIESWRWLAAGLLSLSAIAFSLHPIPDLASLQIRVESEDSTLNSGQRAISPQLQMPLYWLSTTNNQIRLIAVPTTIPAGDTTTQQITQAINALLLTTPPSGTATTIPPQTRLYKVEIHDQAIAIDLSPEFLNQSSPTTLATSIAQIVLTATVANPEAQVYLAIAGKPLTSISKTGVLLKQPLTRQQFEQQFAL